MRHDGDHEAGRRTDVLIPLAEETASVGSRDVVTGRVRVTTRVETSDEFVHADLADEEIDVVRVAVGRVVDAIPAIRSDGDVTIVPVVEEVAVVEVRLVLREELHLRRRTGTRSVSVPVSLRRQRVDVERLSADDARLQPDHDKQADSDPAGPPVAGDEAGALQACTSPKA